MSSPNRTLLATGKMGRGREWGSRASHTVGPWTWEPGGKGNGSFLRSGYPGPWTSGGTETEDSPPGPPPGEGAALFSPSPERKSKFQHLRVGRIRAASSTSWTTWGLAGMRGGAALLREAWRAGQGIDSAWGGAATGRLRPGPGGSGGWCITPGQDVLDRLGLLLYCRELLGEAIGGFAEQPSLGDGGVEKACLVDVLHLCQVETEMALLDHHDGHRLSEGPRHDFRLS